MSKYVEVATTQGRAFVEALLILGAAGATIPTDCATFKGALLRTKVFVPGDNKFKVTNCMRIIDVKDEAPVKEAPKTDEKLSREALEVMSLGELRKATGIAQGGKEAIIKEYLGEE